MMKNTYYFLIFLCFHQLGCQKMTSTNSSNHLAYTPDTVATLINDSILQNIQKKINTAFASAVVSKAIDPLVMIEKQLDQVYEKHPQNLVLYWMSYLYYYKAIYYLQNEDTTKSAHEINLGLDAIDTIKMKNSEDYALLGMLQGFAIQFKSNLKKGVFAVKTKQNLNKAIQLESQNPRAHYVMASTDFYTPKKYGGGKLVEKHLLKALALPEQLHPNSFLPSWGKEESYTLLIQFYTRTEQLDRAKTYFKEAVALYPQSYSITNLAQTLID